MAYKFIGAEQDAPQRGTLYEVMPGEKETNSEILPPETWREYLSRNVARPPVKALGALADIPSALGNLMQRGFSEADVEELTIPDEAKQKLREKVIKGELPQLPYPSETIEKVLPESWRQPRTTGQEWVDKLVSQLPYAAASSILGGAPFLKTAASLAGGVTAEQMGKNRGATGIEQALLNIGGTALTGRAINTVSDFSNFVNNSAKQAYKISSDIGKNASVFTGDYTNKLTRLYDKLILPIEENKVLKPVIDAMRKNVSTNLGNFTDVDTLMTIKKELNSALTNPKTAERAKPLIKKLVGETKDILQDYAKTNPTFNKNYFGIAEPIAAAQGKLKQANELIMAPRNLNKFWSTNVYGKMFKSGKEALGIAGVPLSLIYQNLLKFPFSKGVRNQILPHLQNVWLSALQGDKIAVANQLAQADKILKKEGYSKKSLDEISAGLSGKAPMKGYRFIKAGI